ncbi:MULTISPECIES: alpha/beta fold hydrolase [unclassified Crossiella]|uniref:alpha/beta fold hydrolase n=1 Tax=unclassified Crossiella TaxID=2620835 RepID=UPI001FFF107E|nr:MULTISPECIES: alpha/beta fold hydrolase [unclassified Crossiella]MCK2242900.1 alpha/beta fold hydrolase [Crossiella sp. S99.2]MCK2256777.1 alpha/beta fold hydrolase [Crossiella sp. S99.1]
MELVYERRGAGAGAPLVLLHGVGHHWQAWEPVLDLVAERRDVIALDFPGFGASPMFAEGVRVHPGLLADVVQEFCAELGLVRPHVAGNSMGGLVALLLGQRGVVSSVTALSPAGLWTDRERAWAFRVLRACRGAARVTPPGVVARLAESGVARTLLTGMIYGRPAARSASAVVAEVRALREATGFDVALRVGREFRFSGVVPADVPVTVAWGDRDRVLSRRQGLRARELAPQARLVELPGCGHVPMSDDPELVASVLLRGSAGESVSSSAR